MSGQSFEKDTGNGATRVDSRATQSTPTSSSSSVHSETMSSERKQPVASGSGQSAAIGKKGQRFHFIIKDKCLGITVNSRATGPTCYGFYDVDYKLKYNGKHTVPRYMLSRETIMSLKTPQAYRGVCRRNLMVLSRQQAQATELGRAPPVDLNVRAYSYQYHIDIKTTFLQHVAAQSQQQQQLKRHSAAQASASTLSATASNTPSIWQMPARVARTSLLFAREQATCAYHDLVRRRAAAQATQRTGSMWQSAKLKWKSWKQAFEKSDK